MKAVAAVTICAFLVGATAPAFADQAPSKVISTHSVTAAELHRTAQSFQEQANAVRSSFNAYLAQPDVKSQMNRIGIGADKVAAQVARLSDAELARVQQQLMAADVQMTPAGLSRNSIMWIAVGGAALLALLYLSSGDGSCDITQAGGLRAC